MTRFKLTLSSILLALLFSLTSCKKEHVQAISDTENHKDTLAHIHPNTTTYKKLSAAYVSENQEKIDLFYKKYWDKNNVSGGLLVAKDGQIIFEKYAGYSNFKTKKEIDMNTPIHLASVSKRITAAAVMVLVNAGKLELDQKVNTILKSFPYPEVTVRTLLNHRSGLNNYAYFFDDRKIWDQKNQVTNQDILDQFVKHNVPLDFKTDKHFAYCNTNYAMLALIIEKVTGLNYRDAMKRMIFDPLEMKNTFVIDYEKQYEKESQSYKGNYRFHELNHLETVYGDKNIYSTPRDLLKFQQAVASKDYLTPKLTKEVFKGYSYERKGTRNYGLGIRMMEWNDGKQLFYHNGWWHGNTTSYVDLRDENIIIIALSNKYTTMTYKSFYLATLFGDYPLKLKKDDLPF